MTVFNFFLSFKSFSFFCTNTFLAPNRWSISLTTRIPGDASIIIHELLYRSIDSKLIPFGQHEFFVLESENTLHIGLGALKHGPCDLSVLMFGLQVIG